MDKKLYKVTFEFESVIAAEDLADAYETARSYKRDIVSDDDGVLEVDPEPILTAEELPPAWNDECYPYGGEDEELNEHPIKVFLATP